MGYSIKGMTQKHWPLGMHNADLCAVMHQSLCGWLYHHSPTHFKSTQSMTTACSTQLTFHHHHHQTQGILPGNRLCSGLHWVFIQPSTWLLKSSRLHCMYWILQMDNLISNTLQRIITTWNWWFICLCWLRVLTPSPLYLPLPLLMVLTHASLHPCIPPSLVI